MTIRFHEKLLQPRRLVRDNRLSRYTFMRFVVRKKSIKIPPFFRKFYKKRMKENHLLESDHTFNMRDATMFRALGKVYRFISMMIGENAREAFVHWCTWNESANE